MKKAQTIRTLSNRFFTAVPMMLVLLLIFMTCNTSPAYQRYKNNNEDSGSNCSQCHGDFNGPVTTKESVFPSNDKHEMHRDSSAMGATSCNVCHTSGDGRNPYLGSSNAVGDFDPGLGCSGCHEGLGLRAHHAANGVTTCASSGCHDSDAPPPAEGTIPTPSYYGVTAISKVANPCNDVPAANTNENWTIGDFVGLDNDGDNLYDLADFDCGPPYHIVGIEVLGNDVQISWETVGGRTDILEASSNLTNTFSDVGSVVTNSGTAFMTNSVVEIGGASNTNRFYRIKYAP